MTWQPFSLHFKQIYAGGARYLDRCGELMVAAEEKLDLMPDEAKPIGCKMSLPEESLNVILDSVALAVVQEFHKDDGALFINVCQALADLVQELFRPRNVESNGFASKDVWAFSTAAKAAEATLRLGDELPTSLSRVVEMPASEGSFNYHFQAGSMDLNTKIHPATLETVTLQRHTSPPRATASQRRRAERLNRRSDRTDTSVQHVVMMELDLIEFDPPMAPLAKHYDLLRQKGKALQTRVLL